MTRVPADTPGGASTRVAGPATAVWQRRSMSVDPPDGTQPPADDPQHEAGSPSASGGGRAGREEAEARAGDGLERPAATPSGEVYDWYRRGVELLDRGDADAAAQVLAHARAAEPASPSVLEALARAFFDSRRYRDAADAFAELAARSPDSDYARFGLGLALARLDRHEEALQHLSLAAVMRPGRRDYVSALRQTRATLQARAEASGGGAPGGAPSDPTDGAQP